MLPGVTGVVAHKLKSANTYVLASLVKLFFRSLREPLFTEALYTRFAEGIGTSISGVRRQLTQFLLRSVHVMEKENCPP